MDSSFSYRTASYPTTTSHLDTTPALSCSGSFHQWTDEEARMKEFAAVSLDLYQSLEKLQKQLYPSDLQDLNISTENCRVSSGNSSRDRTGSDWVGARCAKGFQNSSHGSLSSAWESRWEPQMCSPATLPMDDQSNSNGYQSSQQPMDDRTHGFYCDQWLRAFPDASIPTSSYLPCSPTPSSKPSTSFTSSPPVSTQRVAQGRPLTPMMKVTNQPRGSSVNRGGSLRREAPADKVCEYCGVGFTRNERLRYHIQRVHLQSDPEFECGVSGCLRAFRQRSDLQRHQRTVHRSLLPTTLSK